MCSARLLLISCLLTITILTIPVYTKDYISIDSPEFRKFQIAIPEFIETNPITRTQNIGPELRASLIELLNMTGCFDIINEKAYLEKATGNVVFANWAAIGTDYLVKCALQHEPLNIKLFLQLFDIIKEEALISKTYVVKKDSKSDFARKAASEIFLAITGEKGPFNTRVAFVAKKDGASTIYTLNFDGTGLTKLTEVNTIAIAPRWSPDGRYLSFTSYRDGNPDMYILDMADKRIRKRFANKGINIAGSWNADSDKFLITMTKDGNEQIYLASVAESKARQLTHSDAINISPTFSPDNRKIAYVSSSSGNPQIFVMNADGSNNQRITFSNNYNTSPSWSPKGNAIAYESKISGRFHICVVDENGGNFQQLTRGYDDSESPSWSPDGRFIAFAVRKKGVFIMSADGYNVRLIFKGDSSGVAWSPSYE